MSDEIEVGSVLAGQVERIPAYPDDEIGLVGTLLAEAVQARGTGKVTVADAYLAPDGCAALDGLGTVLVGQPEMREAAASEVVNRVQPPTGRLAARLAKATAVASTQAASGPTHSRTRSLVRPLEKPSRRPEPRPPCRADTSPLDRSSRPSPASSP